MGIHTDSQTASVADIQVNVAITFIIVPWIAVLIRIYVRAWMIHNFGWDDALIVVTQVMLTIYCAGLIVLASHGGGTHLTDMSQIKYAIDWILVCELFYILCVMILKLSLGIFFMRIVVRTWQKVIIYAVMFISTCMSIFFFFWVLFQCGNPKLFFQKQIAGKCAPVPVNLALAYTHATMATLSDWIFALLPVIVLWGATMDFRTKFSVGFILSLGAAGSICSVVRFKYLDGLVRFHDFFWNAANCAIWSAIEPGAGVIAASLATYRPLLRRFCNECRTHLSNISLSASARRLSRSIRSRNPSSTTRKSEKGSKTSSAQRSLSNRFSFRPWERPSTSHTHTTTTCIGGRDTDAELGDVKSSSNQPESRQQHVQTNSHGSDSDGPWPFVQDEHIIQKAVDFEVMEELEVEVDRRSSHTLGEEEAGNVRHSFRLPPRRGDEEV